MNFDWINREDGLMISSFTFKRGKELIKDLPGVWKADREGKWMFVLTDGCSLRVVKNAAWRTLAFWPGDYLVVDNDEKYTLIER